MQIDPLSERAQSPQPTLTTPRLVLRPFRREDASRVKRLAGEREVADATSQIPHPYEDGMAEQWIATHDEAFAERKHATFALTLRDEGELVGACALSIDRQASRGELGYWIGKPYWHHGFATEAGRAVMAFGFEFLELNRIYARHLARNAPSGRVMEKLGMLKEGVARQDAVMWGEYEDVVSYGILRVDWLKSHADLPS
ncbi:MAG: GNAT family N-acetyltransferase [Pseudomonadota bacterium]